MLIVIGIIFILISLLPNWENKIYARTFLALISVIACAIPFIDYSFFGFNSHKGLWLIPGLSIYYLLKVVKRDCKLTYVKNLGVSYILIDLLNLNLLSSYYLNTIVLLLILLVYGKLFDKWSRICIYCLIIINAVFKLYAGYYSSLQNEPNLILSSILVYSQSIKFSLYLILTLWAVVRAIRLNDLNYFSLVWPYLAYKTLIIDTSVSMDPVVVAFLSLSLFIITVIVSNKNIDIIFFILTFIFSLKLGDKVYWYLNGFIALKLIYDYVSTLKVELLSIKFSRDIVKHLLLFIPVLSFVLLKSWELQLITLLTVILVGRNIMRYSHD